MYLKNSKKIVIKIGSSLLVDQDKKIRKKWLSSFAKDIKKLRLNNQKVIIVSSGAIALGCKKMNYNKKNLKLDKSQAIASIGQIELMNLFLETFSKYKLDISQILLTLDDTEERRRSINAKRTFENLFQLNYVPIVNENDTIATSEIKYGDNDRLASRVAQITGADTLILLSDVDGLFTKNPKIFNNKAKVWDYISMIKEENKRMNAQVENVLRISKLQKKQLIISKDRLQLHELIEDAITHVELIVKNRAGYIKTNFKATKASILANDSYFTNVIVNILDNAIKYSEGPPKIDITTENHGNSILMSIKDQGVGIGKVAQKRVFEEFYREHTGNVHNVKGHGLGLANVKRIVENHQGIIFIESEKGKGSTFTIKLPLIT